MTTWDDCYYKDDTLAKMVTYMDIEDQDAELLWNTFGYSIKDFNDAPVKNEEELRTFIGIKKMFPDAYTRNSTFHMNTLRHLLSQCDEVSFGMSAVLNLLYDVYDGSIVSRHEIHFDKQLKLVTNALQMNLLASLTTPKKIDEMLKMAKMPDRVFHLYASFINFAQMLQHLSFYWRSPDYASRYSFAKAEGVLKEPLLASEMYFGPFTQAYCMEGIVYLLVERKTSGKKVLYAIINRQSMRIENTFRAMAKAIHYFTGKHRFGGIPLHDDIFYALLDMFMQSIKSQERHNEVARAWDTVFHTYLAYMSRDITDRAYVTQMAKIRDNKYDEIVNVDSVIELMRKVNFAEAVDFLKLYKVLPCPDFDPLTGFLNMKQYHLNQHTYGVPHPTLSEKYPDIQLNDRDFHRFQRLQLMRRVRKKYGYMPLEFGDAIFEYLKKNPKSELAKGASLNPNKLTPEEIDMIPLTGQGEWQYRNTNSPDYYVDKACAPQGQDLTSILSSEDFYKQPLWERNYMSWFLRRPSIPTTDELRMIVKNSTLEKQQIAYFKPESKKPEPRNFYSAKPYVRIMNSEFEENVSRYMSHDVASFQSKDPRQRALAMNSILGSAEDKELKRLVYISFDLSKFSPCMGLQTKKAAYRVWEDFFGLPNIDAHRQSYENVTLTYFHHGISQHYVVPSMDAEGQSGKLNTAYHEDVMAYAVRILRRSKLYEGSGKLAVFIDDGLLCLQFPKETSDETVNKVLDVIEMVYYYFGLRISWDKTFVSGKLATFLNEIYYDGHHVDIGFKAILKMQLGKLRDEMSISGKIKGLVAMAKAATVNGVNSVLTTAELYRELFQLLGRQLRAFDRQNFGELSDIVKALWLHTPVSLGGAGVPFMLTWLSTPNVDTVQDFYCSCEYLTHCVSSLEPLICKIFQQQMRPRHPLAYLRAPLAFRTTQPTLTEYKHLRFVSDAVRKFAQNPVICAVMHADFAKVAQEIMAMLGTEADLWEVEQMYESSVIGVMDKFVSKYKRSSSILSMLPVHRRSMLTNMYQTELSRTIDGFIHTLTV